MATRTLTSTILLAVLAAASACTDGDASGTTTGGQGADDTSGTGGTGGAGGQGGGVGGAGGETMEPSPLDVSFGDGGYVVTSFGDDDRAWAVEVAEDDAILVAGVVDGTAYVARYQAEGSLDESFGDAGVTVLSPAISGDERIGLGRQQDGRILLLSYRQMTQTVFVSRLDGGGNLDATFGDAGTFAAALELRPAGLRVTADDSLIIGGERFGGFVAAKLSADGALDASYGDAGVAHVVFPGSFGVDAHGLTLQPDGKLIVCGNANDGTAAKSQRLVMARFDPSGAADTSFGSPGYNNTGWVLYDLDSNRADSAQAVTLDAEGRILAAGYGAAGSSTGTFMVARFESGGVLDPSFQMDGVAYGGASTSSKAEDILLDGDQRIWLLGQASYGFLARSLADGSPDPQFGNHHTYDGQFHLSGADIEKTRAGDFALDAQGRLVVVGYQVQPDNAEVGDSIVMRLLFDS